MLAAKNLGVATSLYQFGIPVGLTLCKSTLCIYIPVVVLSLANIYGIEMPFSKVLSVILSTVILVLAMPGIPGVSIIILSSLLIMSGCPVDALGMVIGIDPIVDMLATPVGVFGVLVLVLVVAKSEKMLNK